jgi:hypothetical protein
MRSLRSLPVVGEEVRMQQQLLLRHFDGLDSKAGVTLGFAGALAALAPVDLNGITEVGRALAVAGGMAALWSFWPRRFATIDVRELRDGYLASELEFTQLRLLDAQIASIERTTAVMVSKGLRLRIAMATLAAATLFVAIGVGVD